MTRSEQRAAERGQLETMIRLLDVPIAAEPVDHDPPDPDFELELVNGRRVGVEVTEARDPDIAAAWGDTRDRLQSAIKKSLAARAANVCVTGSADVSALFPLRRSRDLTKAAEQVLTVVLKCLPDGLAPTRASKLGIDFLSSLEVRRSAKPEILITLKGGPLGPQVIQAAIDAKARKLDGYRALGASEYWLLVVGGAVLSGYVTVGHARSTTFTSPFDRTIFLDESEPASVVLDTRKADE